MNKKIVLSIFLLTLSSCQKIDKRVLLPYVENGGLVLIEHNDFIDKFENSENILTFLTIKHQEICSTCIDGSFASLNQYCNDNNFIIYHYQFDVTSETFVDDYNSLYNLTNEKNDNGLKPLSYENNLPLISDLPSLMFSSLGYIGFNIQKDFIDMLESTVRTEKI